MAKNRAISTAVRLVAGLVLLGVAPLTACSSADPPPPDASATPLPSSDSCGGRTPDPTAPPSLVSGTGSVTEGPWTVAIGSLSSGYAQRVAQNLVNENEEIFIYLSTRPNSCGHVRSGIAKSGEPLLLIAAASYPGTKFSLKSYQGVRISVDGLKEGLPPGPCHGVWPWEGDNTNPRGTLVITALDANHVAGSYTVVASPDAGAGGGGAPSITIEFDVPFCWNRVKGGPPQCCVP